MVRSLYKAKAVSCYWVNPRVNSRDFVSPVDAGFADLIYSGKHFLLDRIPCVCAI